MVDRVDLLLLSVKAPLADAVRATACSRWQEAVDLWLDVFREPRYRTLATWCGLEAALKAGLYDLAQYFHIGVDEGPSLPDFLAEPWRQSLPIRRNRARVHAEQVRAPSRADAREATRRLVHLRLYREAIRESFRSHLFETDRGAAVPLLAECYFALGEHEALLALHRYRRLYFIGRGAGMMLGNAKTCLAREARGPVENTLDFARRHPAGFLLAPFLESPESVLARHG